MNQTPSTTRQPGTASATRGESAKTARRSLPRNLTYRSDPAEFDADVAELWAMSVEERIAAMRARRLTGTQLTEWSGHRPDEVPRVGVEPGEFEYIAMCSDEHLDDPTHSATVIQLPQHKEVRDVAA